jgi:hypothetical protein
MELWASLTYKLFNFNEPAHAAAVTELDGAGDLGEERIILANADVRARLQTSAALTDDDGTAGNKLAAENLYAKPLSVRIAAIFGTT